MPTPPVMRLVVIVALVAVLAVLLVRHSLLGRDHRISIGVVVVLVLVLGVLEFRWSSSVGALSRAARVIAPQSQGVSCQRATGTLAFVGSEQGHVDFDAAGRPSSTALITYETCARLFDYLRSDKRTPTLDQITAVHTLTHEAVHLTGQLSESLTECAAMQRDAQVAGALGASPAQAASLARMYAALVYPRMIAPYRDAGCRADGPLDESPGDGVWP